ncbi:CoA ester lyase [Nitratiruptor sp. YY09-18]|uniref:HpcH/HpaI aldolase/citrate lyase family protein n=1 Tax=Nitratiruptor sp. YY09-18 TaxID=2724901 RepID=UPI001915E60E|nr:aldolase/citrate lyase family protein [Nitratiruptor sp. YY09-18]BCD67915.1 citrate lyase subunit beta / citryl-CoA lyase [Nitratiruptor sp. YY09-18]
MLFDEKFIEIVQEAIDQDNENFFIKALSHASPRQRKENFCAPMMVSALNAKHLNHLDEFPSDAAIINLEDGVAPQKKRIALLAACYFLQHLPQNAPYTIVRINPLDEGGEEEIALLNRFFPHAIRVPKVRSKEDLQRARELIDDAISLHASIETKEAFVNLQTLATSKAECFYLGILDLLADMGIPQNVLKLSNPTIDHILSIFLLQSLANGIKPVSFVYQDYKNIEEFTQWCEYEYAMGYRAKGVLGPKQAEVALRIFKTVDIQRARYIKKRFEAMQKQGITGFMDEKYGFIDEPIYKDALNILKSKGEL